jgi:hypothetical protein
MMPSPVETLHDATLFPHGVVHELREAAHQGEGGFFPSPLGKGGKANHVREKHGDLPALGLHAALPVSTRHFLEGREFIVILPRLGALGNAEFSCRFLTRGAT